jgi:CDP-6-deoxy-D-xylo-4-hexulose-3-dehydrase
MIPSLIGNLPDLPRLQKIAKKHGIVFLEDSCDTLGARFGAKPSGIYSDVSTTSFYASHIITAGGSGGMVCFHNSGLARRALILANWGRESTAFGVYEESENIEKRFSKELEGVPYDAKFVFSEVGYNFQPTELSAAFGLEQIKRLEKFMTQRKENFSRLRTALERYECHFVLPQTHQLADTAWLAFPLEIRQPARFSRYAITKFLEENGVQTRPVFTGNIFKQPAFKRAFDRLKIRSGNFPIADRITNHGILVGCHQAMTEKDINYLRHVFDKFLSVH